MKIVYIATSIIPSRTANSIHVMKMCQAFADNGHKVTLLVPYNKEQSTDVYLYYGVKRNFMINYVSFFNISKIRLFSYAWNVFKYLNNVDFNIVYGRDLKSCFLATIIKKDNVFNVFYESHKPYEKYNFIHRIVLKKIVCKDCLKKIIVISNSLKKMYLKHDLLVENKIIVAHDGANEPKDDQSIESIVKSNKLNIGYTGQLYQGRGIDIILKIAEKLKNMVFHIVGGNPPDIEYWKSRTNANNVIFHGFIDPCSVYKYVNSFDVLLAPYQAKVSIEGKGDSSSYMSPLKIFEYMASKKAIVISDLPVLHEVLERNEAEFVKYNDSEGWIKALEKLRNQGYREDFAYNAYKKYKNAYTWKKRAENVIK